MTRNTETPKSDTLHVDEIVLTAAALDTEDRDRYLRDLSSVRPELISRARGMLQAAASMGDSFLAEPVSLPDNPESIPEPIDTPLAEDRYQRVRSLGRGGMAEVFLAEDLHLQRPVALKMLSSRDADVLKRSLQEARIQAKVRHRNVVDVYETGVLEGRPYIAMRFISGRTLAEVAADMPLERKIHLLIQVAEGLDAAHRIGLLHRDVKPSNILVESSPDGDVHAWVMDFGIAAETVSEGDESNLVGTPAYMAPEHLEPGHKTLDRRSDVYSLGATMYHVLAGVPPFTQNELMPLLHSIRNDTALRLLQHDPTLPRELDAVVTRCMTKEPKDRYPSARAVAEDLQRFLNGEIVEAYTASLAYRITRFVVRHRVLLSMLGIAAVLLMLALTVAAIMGVAATRANDRAQQRRHQAEELIGFMLGDLRTKLTKVGRLELLDDVGAQAMAYFAAVPKDELSDEELARRSTALHQLGDVRVKQGRMKDARAPFSESLRLAEALVERHPNDLKRWFDLGQSQFWVGYIHWRDGDFNVAQEHFEAYLRISQKLVAEDPTQKDWQMELGYAYSNLGTLLRDRGRLNDALTPYRKRLEVFMKLHEAAPNDDRIALKVGVGHNVLGDIYDRLGDPKALFHFKKDLEIEQRLFSEAPEDLDRQEKLAIAHNYLGNGLLSRGRWSEAEPHFTAAIERSTALVAHDPDNTEWRFELGVNHLGRGYVRRTLGQKAAAMADLRAHRTHLEFLLARTPEDRGYRKSYVEGAIQLGRIDGNLERCVEANDRLTELAGMDHQQNPEVLRRWAESLICIGDLRLNEGRETEANDAWRRAQTILSPIVSGSSDWMVKAVNALIAWRLDGIEMAQEEMRNVQALGLCAPTFVMLCDCRALSSETNRTACARAQDSQRWDRNAQAPGRTDHRRE